MKISRLTASAMTLVLLTAQSSFASLGYDDTTQPASLSGEVKQGLVNVLESATSQLRDELEWLEAKMKMAKDEAAKNRYTNGAAIAVKKYFYVAYRADLAGAKLLADAQNKAAIEANGSLTMKQVMLAAPPVIVTLTGVTFAVATAKNLIVGPFRAVFSTVDQHFSRKDVGMVRKIVTSVTIPFKVVGALLTLGTTVAVDGAIVYFSGLGVYGLSVPQSQLNEMINAADLQIQSANSELAALRLFE